MREPFRTLNNQTYRECFIVCDEVTRARKGRLIRIYDYPAAVVSCALSWTLITDSIFSRSGKVSSLSYRDTPALEQALNVLGSIGTRRYECTNYIGGCAEPHAARVVMKENPTSKVRDLVFSYTYRPRTKTVLRYCRNCTDVFNVQNP